jgi:hypothetical protein
MIRDTFELWISGVSSPTDVQRYFHTRAVGGAS